MEITVHWIVLSTEDKLPFLEQPIPVLQVPPQGLANPLDVITTHQAWVKAQKEIVGLMLMTIDPEIQKTLEHLGAYDMLQELKTLYLRQIDQELLQTVQEFYACKKEKRQSVSSYVLKMKSYIDNLERLGHAMTRNLFVSLILVSLRKEYDSFVQNYNVHSMGKTVNELHAMLKLHEQTLPPKEVAPALHAIRAGRIQKNQKKKSHKAAKGNQGKGKAKMTKDAICHQCGEVGHWRRNCPIYLSELMKKKKLSQGASTLGIFTIELYSFPSTSWVYDTGCGTHICITTQGLRGSKKLKPRALSLYVGDGHRATIEAIGDFHLCLPSGLVLILHNCHYAPSITRGIISVSRLYKDGFVNRFEDNSLISMLKNTVIYFNAIPRDDIYEIVMSSSNTNECSMYAVTNKRSKPNLDFALLWHYHLGHINKKLTEKLQHDGLLDLTDIKSFEKCVACMSSKMTRKPYSHQVESAKDLLGLIHTDVYGPFKIMSRQGAYYSVAFTDDFSRYGYVYLLKHKHEVLETFKVFQKEVENQLGKTIKLLRSDRSVRNRTLLDMVRSMMTQTTLLKSFWDYAFESAACILNMVPTKKGCKALVKRDSLTKPDKLEPRSIKCIFVGYPKETIGYSFYYPPENKIFVAQNVEFFKNGLINHKASGSLKDLEIIQEEDTHPSLDTSLNHEEDDQEIDEPQSDINPIRRSTRTRRAPDRMCLYIDAEKHELGDLGEPANYKAALLDPESEK
nr:zinc finger, CCHC-type [Tanacetum cinerariifolium]